MSEPRENQLQATVWGLGNDEGPLGMSLVKFQCGTLSVGINVAAVGGSLLGSMTGRVPVHYSSRKYTYFWSRIN